MKKMVLLLTVIFLITLNTNAAKLQFVFWTNGAPAVSDAQMIGYYMTSLKAGSIVGAEVRSTVNNYKEIHGEEGYKVLISAQASDFTVGYSTGVEQNWGLENGKSVITGTLVAGVKIIFYKGVPVAKWGSNGCLNPLTVLPITKNDPVDGDNYAGNTPVNTNRQYQSGPNPNVNNSNINNFNDPSGLATLAVFKDGIASERASMAEHTLLLMAYGKSLQTNAPCNVCPQTTAATPVQQVAYAQQPLLYAQTSVPAVAQQQTNNGRLDVSGTVNVRNNTRAVDVINTVFNGANAVANVKNAFWGYDVNLKGVQQTLIQSYPNTWPVNTNGQFQGSSVLGANYPATTTNGLVTTNQTILPLSNNLGTGSTGTVYDNQWAEQQRQLQLQQSVTNSYGGLVRIGN